MKIKNRTMLDHIFRNYAVIQNAIQYDNKDGLKIMKDSFSNMVDIINSYLDENQPTEERIIEE